MIDEYTNISTSVIIRINEVTRISFISLKIKNTIRFKIIVNIDEKR